MSGDVMTHNNCNMREGLVSFLYDEMTPEEKLRVQTHLTECAACKQELEAFERVRGMLQQWQLDDMPVVRLATGQRSGSRSFLAALKELLSVTPVWARALGAVATAMLVLAVMGTEVSVGSGGVSFHADLLRRDRQVSSAGDTQHSTTEPTGIQQIRAEMKSLVNQLVAEREGRQRDDMSAELASLQSQLQNAHSADLAKVLSRIQEQQARLKTIEQDIDRREGLDLTDILFSEIGRSERSTNGGD
jgi:hypothetical protein